MEKWSGLAFHQGKPLRMRTVVIKDSSNSGTPHTSTIWTICGKSRPLCRSSSDIEAARNPSRQAPASPRNIDAGGRLNQRNPRQAPAAANAREAQPGTSMDRNARVRAEIPPTRPSHTSVKLNALTTVTIQKADTTSSTAVDEKT